MPAPLVAPARAPPMLAAALARVPPALVQLRVEVGLLVAAEPLPQAAGLLEVALIMQVAKDRVMRRAGHRRTLHRHQQRRPHRLARNSWTRWPRSWILCRTKIWRRGSSISSSCCCSGTPTRTARKAPRRPPPCSATSWGAEPDTSMPSPPAGSCPIVCPCQDVWHWSRLLG